MAAAVSESARHHQNIITATGASSAYHEYPPSQPFINDDYRRDVTKPIIAYPESNRQGVMSALKNLQQKIKQIEREKQQAELIAHNSRYDSCMSPDIIGHSKPISVNVSAGALEDTTATSDVHGKLLAQEERCRLLERQLEQTRLMVQHAEHDRAEALRKMTYLHDGGVAVGDLERQAYANRIKGHEREHLRLAGMESKADDMNEDLLTKPHRRRKKRSSSAARVSARAGRGAIGRKYPSSSTATNRAKLPGSEPPEHYHLNLNEIPFLTGKSTGQSYSLSANFQQVLSLMKSHNSKLCSGPNKHSHAHVTRQSSLSTLRRTATQAAVNGDDGNAAEKSTDEFGDLLLQLEDEFNHMRCEHDELTRQLKEARDPRLKDDLERELDALVGRMEIKGSQITKLKHLRELVTNQGNEKKKNRCRGRSKSAAMSRLPASDGVTAGEVITFSCKGRGALVRPPSSCSKAQGSLNLLKDLKKIQTTLRQDDIMWDC